MPSLLVSKIFVLSSCYPAHYHPQGVIVCNKTGRIIVIIPLSHYPILEIYYAELWPLATGCDDYFFESFRAPEADIG